MAHECPYCYTNCYCNGDIDDICLDGTEEQLLCNHHEHLECCGHEEFCCDPFCPCQNEELDTQF
jgi:hypothetical protein